VLIVNGHGGNDELLQLVVRDLAMRHPVNLATLSYWLPAMGDLTALHEGIVSRLPGHAGAFETSLVMALRPELTPQSLPHRDPSDVARLSQQQSGWRLERHGWWQTIDGFGDSPDLADAARGQASLDAVVAALAAIIRDVYATPLPEDGKASGSS
jgi:creatinine amidohydrolase